MNKRALLSVAAKVGFEVSEYGPDLQNTNGALHIAEAIRHGVDLIPRKVNAKGGKKTPQARPRVRKLRGK